MKNLQGDIIGITDTSGNIVAKYTYDSWGKLISIKDSNDVDKTTDENFIGYINPIRYRGYYYDTETGLYYLNARYYDPEVGRFISSDETLSGGYNLFEYCYNNPVNTIDPEGYSGVLQIFAHINHAWITFTSDQTGITHSIGTWDGSHGKLRGVNYDIEAWGIANRNWYTGRVSLSAHINDTQEQDLLNFIQHNNRWELWYNCSSFAADAWEAAGQQPLSNKMWFLIPTPRTLAESIKQVPGYQIDAPIIPI